MPASFSAKVWLSFMALMTCSMPIWNRIKGIYPNCQKVLNYYHCSEYLYIVADAQYGKSAQKAREWVEATLARLFLKQADRIAGAVQIKKYLIIFPKHSIAKFSHSPDFTGTKLLTAY